MRIAVFRKAHFNAAHKLYVPSWSEERNYQTFGKCANPHYHGHNYELEVKVVGETDPVTGMLIDLKVLKDIIREHVEDKLDHRNLNEEIPEFQELIPTAENICHVIWKILREQLDEKFELTVRLWETPRNYVEYPA
jgi:6-pyruvoyltetrahydropterin/6-carboxytetrahydropterin synthase